ncbi:PIN domain-containing protein [Pedobacter sp. MW01-1-1]|uniref:PIN domain-containing protein n=1 Tax=Pedobacter sp. MW01-1-1 TaxID=3383027 RepID=UPI003FF0A876
MRLDNVLIDSDVLLDFFLQREPFLIDSIGILTICERKKVKGFTTGLILANSYYLLRKHFEHKNIMSDFKKLLSFLDVLTMDKNSILQSIDSEVSDFEDALQNYSAENHNGIDAIITRNIKDYKKSNLIILTPRMFLEAR